MKRKTNFSRVLIISIVVVAGIAVSYILTNDSSDTGLVHEQTAEERATAEITAKDLAQMERNYVFPQKDEFVDRMRKELAGIQGELSQITAQQGQTVGGASAEETKLMNATREKWTDAKRHLDLAEDATESNWFDLNRGFRKSFSKLKASVEETRRQMSDKKDS